MGPGGYFCRLSKTHETRLLGFWDNAIVEIDGWWFLKSPAHGYEPIFNPTISQVLHPPSQDGWLATMRSVNYLWNRLKDEGFEYLLTRYLNQDPLEHLFGDIRANCGSNSNPTVGQFQAALKTAIVNGLAFKALKGTNCEFGEKHGHMLDKLKDFLFADLQPPCGQEPSPCNEEDPETHDLVVEEEVPSDSVAYVSGYIARRLLEGNTCDNCICCLIASEIDESFHSGILAREHADNRLTYSSEELSKAVGTGATLLEKLMPEVTYLPGVWKRVAGAIKETVNFDWIGEKCVDHKVPLIDGIVRGICAISIPWWCRRKNTSLKEDRQRNKHKRKLRILNHM